MISCNFAKDIYLGLLETPKCIYSEHLYDDEGSRFFQGIMDEKDYYLSDCEIEILELNKQDIAYHFKTDSLNVIELCCGDGRKTQILLRQFLNESIDVEYFPIDISKGAIDALSRVLKQSCGELRIRGIVGDYFDGLRKLSYDKSRRNLVLFMGSNIGNMLRGQIHQFLYGIWESLNQGDYILVGFDLRKDPDLIQKAYNNEATRNFNYNMLKRINKELGADFDISQFKHYGLYNPILGANESWLISLVQQTVYIEKLNLSFDFAPFEPIHLHYSFKYLESEITAMAINARFKVIKNYYDRKHYCANSLWQK